MKKLRSLDSKVFNSGRRSLRDRWRMVRSLPEFARNVVQTLGELEKAKNKTIVQTPQPVVQPVSPSLVSLNLEQIKNQLRGNRLLLVLSGSAPSQLSFEIKGLKGVSITVGDRETVITSSCQFDGVIHFFDCDPEFEKVNRFFLSTGRFHQYLFSREGALTWMESKGA